MKAAVGTVLALAALCMEAGAQVVATPMLPSVTVTAKTNPNPVEKSYRKMVRGMDLFDTLHGVSPDASLRFKLLPRRRDTDMANIELEVFGSTVSFALVVAPDHSFILPRDKQAFDEDAQVSSNRKARSLTWRAEIRTSGLPSNTRRLGDLRLECRVGMEAGLVSDDYSLIGKIAQVFDTPAYCDRKTPRYLFFADRPLFSVVLVDGLHREILAIDKLYADAIDEPRLKDELPYCDCEVLVDHAYELPLGDRSWSDNTLVELEYMDGE